MQNPSFPEMAVMLRNVEGERKKDDQQQDGWTQFYQGWVERSGQGQIVMDKNYPCS